MYGETWDSAILSPTDVTWLDRAVGYQPLVRWDPEFANVTPNVAASFEVNSDATEYVFELRPGLRWSDGKPFTADDVVFAQNDMLANQELGGTDPVRASKVDDHTVRFVHPAPNSLWIQQLASTFGMSLIKPMHYLKTFHRTYNPDVDQLAAEGEARRLGGAHRPAGRPVDQHRPADAQPVGHTESTQNRIVVERNPYFWKVDQDGRQLPYIDRAVFTVISNAETMLLKAENGEIDMQVRTFNTPSNKPVLAKARESGGYRFFDAPSTWMNTLMIAFNLCAGDPVKRQVFTEYDLKLAAQHLDRAGLRRRDGDGFRLGPDGRRFTAGVMVKAEEPQMVSTLNLAKDYWAEVGVDIKVDAVDGGLKFTRVTSNQHEGSADSGDGGAGDAWLDPRWYLPASTSASAFAIPWALWYVNGGKSGTEPDASTAAGRAARGSSRWTTRSSGRPRSPGGAR